METLLPCVVLYRHAQPTLLGLIIIAHRFQQHSDASIDLRVHDESGSILHRCVAIAIDGTSAPVSTVTHTQTVLPTVKQYGRILFDF